MEEKGSIRVHPSACVYIYSVCSWVRQWLLMCNHALQVADIYMLSCLVYMYSKKKERKKERQKCSYAFNNAILKTYDNSHIYILVISLETNI